MSSLYFQICSTLYILLIMFVFFKKKKIMNIENKIYSALILTAFFGLILDYMSTYIALVDVENIFLNFISRLYLVYLVVWVYLFTFYTFVISFKNSKSTDSISSMFKKYILPAVLLSFVVIIAFIFILPLYNYSENSIVYTHGQSVQLVYAIAFTGFIGMIVCVLIKYKDLKNQKYLPIYTYIVLSIIAVMVQFVYPQVLLVTSVSIFVTVLMYFTIENPDLKMIEALNEARTQAEKANNAKSDFLSSMSHEIRTPLNAIVGFSQALSEEDISSSAKEEVKDIISASESLLDIVNGILDISKIEANKLEIIDKEYNFKKIFDDLVALTKARMGDKSLEFKYHYDATIPDVLYGDNVRVKQVILNLLTNSVKYTKEGYVDFKINSIIKDDVCRLIISVEDSGIGIKKENVEKLFTKFQRFDEKNTTIEGTGLGLAITKKLLNLMNGKIVVQSIYGKGSRFTIAIDQKIVRDKTLEDIQPKTTNSYQEYDASGKKILIVDDNSLNLKVASRLLINYKADITSIDNGFDCIEKIKNGEQFDLILMDDMMPKMSGVETLHKLQELENFNIPTVALTANAIEGMREKYLGEGFDDYLSKPMDKLELNKVIHKYLNKN